MAEKRENRNQHGRLSINWWKWAFIGLVVLLLLFLLPFRGAFQQVSIHEPNTDPLAYTEQEMIYTTSATRKDTEQLINTFLEATVETKDNQLHVELNDQLIIRGELEVLRLSMPFALSFDPYVLENGNVQLRAVAVELGAVSLPIGATMSLLASQLEIPDFVAIDSATERIVINLNELSKQQKVGTEMVRINLPEDEIQMNLLVDEALIIQNFNSKK